jgi:hypothetical protein
MTPPSSLGGCLQAWRHSDPPITQETIARTADVSLTTAHAWCHGRGCPSVEEIRRLERLKPGLVALLFPEACRAA